MTADHKKKLIDRYAIVACVRAKVATGTSLSDAICEVTNMPFSTLSGRIIRPSTRTLYRWVKAFNSKGVDGLIDSPRHDKATSRVLSQAFLDFLVSEKKLDPDASIPEIILRAELKKIIPRRSVKRTSVWRAARKLNLPLFAGKHPKTDDMRRFAHRYRMQMVLADGKHFRVGPTRMRRVSIAFIDDCSRYVIAVVVGTGETAALFLRGMYKVINRAGIMDGLFLDGGPGFIADDTATICARLDINLIHGRARYPQGHGKIERFNQTYWNDLLRTISDDMTIDTLCSSLEMKLEHYVSAIYHQRQHESLPHPTPEKDRPYLTPEQKWKADDRALEMPDEMRKIEELFLITERRKVAADNVVMVHDIGYETPRGYAGRIIYVFRHLLKKTVTILHNGKSIELMPADLTANARERRARTTRAERQPPVNPIQTSAHLAFERDYATIISPGGDFFEEKDRG